MSNVKFSFVFFILVSQTTYFGYCQDLSFSICWTDKSTAPERSGGNLWLDGVSLKSISKQDRVSSLTVSPAVDYRITLQHRGSVHKWTFHISPGTKSVRVRGRQKPVDRSTGVLQEVLQLLSRDEVFVCGNGTVFFYRDEDFILAVGHTPRFPVTLESTSMSTLLLSWVASVPGHSLTLYRARTRSYDQIDAEDTPLDHHRFVGLDPCGRYAACVEMAGTRSLVCVSTITDPDVPQRLRETWWNSTAVSLAWDCPGSCGFSYFLITAFFMNATGHAVRQVQFAHRAEGFSSTVSPLEPCSRVKLGLQAVCQAGALSRYSEMVLSDGNTEHYNIDALRQTHFSPDSYTLSWEVREAISVAMFRVYHQGAPQGTTLATNYTVRGLQPCQQYLARVEALCGDGALMHSRAVSAHTGPPGVTQLLYHANDSTVTWVPGSPQQSPAAFLYELSAANGSFVAGSRLTEPTLRLPALEDGQSYVLDVWEECGEEWQSEHANLIFEGVNVPVDVPWMLARSADNLGHYSDCPVVHLPMVLPSKVVRADTPQIKAEMEKILQNKVLDLLKDFNPPVRVEVVSLTPAAETDTTQVQLLSFDASVPDNCVLPIEEQLDHIRSLKSPHVTVADEVIYWNGPDLCASPVQSSCPSNSLCINTLGSYTCVCQDGFYDVSGVVMSAVSSGPVCNEKGLFNQCLERLMVGGISKPYLTSYMGGQIEVQLNNGRCAASESETFYFFQTSHRPSECGTTRRVNQTHIELQNTLSVTLNKEHIITRQELKVIWKCVYPLHYVQNARVTVDLEWLSTVSLVEVNSSLVLGLSMTLHEDDSYTSSYDGVISLPPDYSLFFRLALQTNDTFAPDVVLQVVSCWATESTDPQDSVQAVLLEDGCPVDEMLHFASDNGQGQEFRFSLMVFTMPKQLPIYFHCLAHICRHDEDCTKNCSKQERWKRSIGHADLKGSQTTVVSAGPVVVSGKTTPGVHSSHWAEHLTVISIVAASIGVVGMIMLFVTLSKAIMSYYKQQWQN